MKDDDDDDDEVTLVFTESLQSLNLSDPFCSLSQAEINQTAASSSFS